jgi:hypothetical protein
MNTKPSPQPIPLQGTALHVGRRRDGRSDRNLRSEVLQQSLDWHGHLLGWGA